MKIIFRSAVFVALGAAIFIAGVYSSHLLLKDSKSESPLPAQKLFHGAAKHASGISTGITGKVIEVKKGSSIQEAVKKAEAGDVIRVYPGTYTETVYIDKENVSLQGVITGGEWPTLDGEKKLNDAFLYSGNNISIENFKIQNFKGNGIMGQGGNNFVLRNNWIVNAGVYGIFPEFGTNGLIEHNILSGIEDAAIYVGMCDNIDVRHNEVFESVAGIEIENSRHALVEDNYTHDNAGGILAFITPGLPIKTCFDVIIRNNYVVNNNHVNFGAAGSIVSQLPSGSGIIVMAADDVILENNFISGNNNSGITITDHKYGANLANDPGSDPNPDRIVILDNFMFDNGNKPIERLKALMMTKLSSKGPDILAIGGGSGSCIRDKNRYRTFGLDNYAQCQSTGTDSVVSYLLSEPVKPQKASEELKGKMAYYGVCSGCHAYSVRMVGPPTITIQAIYKDNPQGIADFINKPVHKRKDYPEMPPQNYLSEETRLAVAKFMLTVDK